LLLHDILQSYLTAQKISYLVFRFTLHDARITPSKADNNTKQEKKQKKSSGLKILNV